MIRTRQKISALFSSALIITLSACSSGGGDDGLTPTPPPDEQPYPDPTNPSLFPTQADTEEGTAGNNSPGTAGSLVIGDTTYHTIFPVGDVDWLAVTLNVGTQYEFTVDNASYNGIPKLELYDSSGTTMVTFDPVAGDEDWGWGYISFDPRILYTPPATETYYLKVNDQAGGVASYTLSSRIFSDSDSDSFSPHYDCNDTAPNIYPWANEIAADSVDQSCSGYDWPDANATDSVDSSTPDDDFSSAGSLPMLKGDPWDIIHRDEVYAETHTIHSGDVDTFKITVPAYSAYEIMEVESTGALLDSDLYQAPDLANYIDFTVNGMFITHWLDNSASDTATDFYLQVHASDMTSTAAYALGVSDGGSDADGDGYYTRSQGLGWDCDDSDNTIHAGAVEVSDTDEIDSNCNGKDDT